MVRTPARMSDVIAADQTSWLGKLLSSASSMMGMGENILAVSSLARKRDLTTLWELDPTAAPPKAVQKTLVGTAVSRDPQPPAKIDVTCEDPQETRSILEGHLMFAMRRHDVESVIHISRQIRCIENSVKEEAEVHTHERGELRIGDKCFALAKVVEWEWYSARLLRVRTHHPQLQVEYLATMDGDVSSLALPVPHINHIPPEHVRIQAPVVSKDPILPPTVPCVRVDGL